MVKTCICGGSVIFSNGKILLLKHKKLGIWLYPGGHVDEGETPVQTAVREAKEETGYKIKILGNPKLGKLDENVASEQPNPLITLYEHVPYKTEEHMHFDLVYIAQPMGEAQAIEEGESKELKWISKEDVEDLETFPNVKEVLKYAFKVVDQFS